MRGVCITCDTGTPTPTSHVFADHSVGIEHPEVSETEAYQILLLSNGVTIWWSNKPPYTPPPQGVYPYSVSPIHRGYYVIDTPRSGTEVGDVSGACAARVNRTVDLLLSNASRVGARVTERRISPTSRVQVNSIIFSYTYNETFLLE